MNEPLPAFGRLRGLILRQTGDDGTGDLDGILHPVLGGARMDGDAGDLDGDAVGGKILALDLAERAAVQRISEGRTELFQVHLVGAATDLLVGGEEDLDRAVLDLRIRQQELRRRHDLGDACLVVGAEKRRTVGGDDVVADLVLQVRMLVDADHAARITGEPDVAALVVANDLRLDVCAGEIGGRVHVRAEADRRDLLLGVGRQGRIDIAVFVEMRIVQPERPELLLQDAAERQLLLRRRLGGGASVRLGVDDDIAEKAVEHGVGGERHG